MKTFLAAAAICLLSFASEAAADALDDKINPCVQRKGHLFLSGTYWNYHSHTFWNKNGKKRDAFNTFEKNEFSLYAAYGLTRCDTLWVNGGWARIEESLNGRVFGFSDIEIGWKHLLGRVKGHLLTAEIVGIVPAESEFKPGLRYGRFGGEANLLIGKGFCLNELPGSYNVRLGYRVYEGFPSDQFRCDGAVHWKPFRCIRISAILGLEYGVFNGHSRVDQSFFLFNPNYRLLRGEIYTTLSLYKGASAFVGYRQHLWGENVGTHGGALGGLQVQF